MQARVVRRMELGYEVRSTRYEMRRRGDAFVHE